MCNACENRAQNSMARRRRNVSSAKSKSSVVPSETPTLSSNPLAQPSETPEQSSQPLDAPDVTMNRMRTRASIRHLELLKREDEKAQPQAVEPQSPMAIHSSPQTHRSKELSLGSQHLNSPGLAENRMRTRASMRSSELSTKEQQQQQLQPLPVGLQSSMIIQSTPPESSEPQPLDVSGSSKSRQKPFVYTHCLEPLALENEQHKPHTVYQQSPTQRQSQYVEPQPLTTMIGSAIQAGFPEGKSLEFNLADYHGPTKKRKSRGPTRCLELLTREDEQPLSVAANEFGQPIGPNARKLTSFLGTVIRDPKKAPLLWHDWRAMPQKYKDSMWECVQERFQVGDPLKDWVLMSLATKWRNFKAYLKKRYYDGKAGKDYLIINDKRVDPAHWQELVLFWDSEKGKVRSSTNKANRAKLHGVHTAGSRSFAMLREELRTKSPSCQNPSYTEMYMMTHTRKDGRPMDEASAAVMAKLSEPVSEQEALECNTPVDEILTPILGGGRGHVHTVDLGPSPSDAFGPKPTRAQALQMVDEIKKTAEEKLTKMKEQIEAMKAEQEGMKAEQEEMKQKYEDRLAELQTQLQTVMLMVQGNNMNFQVLEQFSLQQRLASPVSGHLLQPSKGTSTVGVGSGLPNILRKRKVIGEIPLQ